MTEIANEDIINSIVTTFEKYVKKGLFNPDFIGPNREYYSGGRCHSRVLGILLEAIQSLGYITDIERSIKFERSYKSHNNKRAIHQFKPDITFVNNRDEIVGLIEYETIDASEDHLYQKIEYFGLAIPANRTLKVIIYLPTLTTLKKAPQKWIEKNRKKYIEPIFTKMKSLSKKYPDLKFYFFDLDEEGLSHQLIENGNIIDKQRYNIFEYERNRS